MLLEFITKNAGLIFLIVFLWLTGISFGFWKFFTGFSSLTKGARSENLIKILEKILNQMKQNSDQLEKLSQDLNKLSAESKGHLQKISLLRFNPFGDVGGDQSFVATFLDGEDSGLIVSSLHSRAGTRVYAKPIEKGEPKQGIKLSTEEERGLKAALSAK